MLSYSHRVNDLISDEKQEYEKGNVIIPPLPSPPLPSPPLPSPPLPSPPPPLPSPTLPSPPPPPPPPPPLPSPSPPLPSPSPPLPSPLPSPSPSPPLGYFTSRPALKGYTRKMNSLLQACKQIESVGGTGSPVSSMTLSRSEFLSSFHSKSVALYRVLPRRC